MKVEGSISRRCKRLRRTVRFILKKIIISILVCIMVIFMSNLYYQSTQSPIHLTMDGVAYDREQKQVVGLKSMEFNGIKTKDWLPWMQKRWQSL